ncbi:dihydrodipicolinate synthase family protein [Bosea sp. NPDC055332]
MDHWLHGMFTALVTPFSAGALDEPSLLRLVDWQVQEGADGIVLGSASGEYSTLTGNERIRLVRLARAAAGPGYPILAAAGSYSTAGSVAEVREAAAAGASAILLRLPYYSRPTQAGLVRHVLSVAEAASLPVIIDNDPDRCAIDLTPEALAEMAAHPAIVGILERRGDLARCDRIMRRCSRHFMRFTGAGDAIPSYVAAGGCGAITSIGNLAPRLLRRIREASRVGAFEQAQTLQRRLIPLYELLSREPDPVAVKLALSFQHPGVSPVCRLPLVAAQPALGEELKYALDDLPRPISGHASGHRSAA